MAHGRQNPIDARILSFPEWTKQYKHGSNYFPENALLTVGTDTFFVCRFHRNHGPFVLVQNRSSYRTLPAEVRDRHLFVYSPLHSSVTAEGVEGAVYAENVDGAWAFAHCTPQEHLDYAALVSGFVIDLFSPELHRLQSKLAFQPDAIKLKRVETNALFASECGKAAYSAVSTSLLGSYHLNGRPVGLKNIAKNAVAKVLGEWKEAVGKGETLDVAASKRYGYVQAFALRTINALNLTVTVPIVAAAEEDENGS